MDILGDSNRWLDGANVVGLQADRNCRRRPITHLRSGHMAASFPLWTWAAAMSAVSSHAGFPGKADKGVRVVTNVARGHGGGQHRPSLRPAA
jgi:hypothetical protein